MCKKIVRVAVNNNFNASVAEFNQLNELSIAHPDSTFFINTNIKTPDLLKINDHPYKAVITLNPDITVNAALVKRIYNISSDRVAFTRIKYIPGNKKILDLIDKISQTLPVVITLQRFNGIKSLTKYVPNFREHYKFSCNRFRLYGESLAAVEALAGSKDRVYICDQAGLGCSGCGLCSVLNTGENLPIYSLNMTSSGICPYSCVDCYAKTMQHFLRMINKPVMHYDWIHKNHKQAGLTKHIKHAKALA